jgi:hypothetical protein
VLCIYLGYDNEEALRLIRDSHKTRKETALKFRHMGAPQTKSQFEYVRSFKIVKKLKTVELYLLYISYLVWNICTEIRSHSHLEPLNDDEISNFLFENKQDLKKLAKKVMKRDKTEKDKLFVRYGLGYKMNEWCWARCEIVDNLEYDIFDKGERLKICEYTDRPNPYKLKMKKNKVTFINTTEEPSVVNVKCQYIKPEGYMSSSAWLEQKNHLYIGRNVGYNPQWKWPKSKWANPFKVGKDGTLDDVLEKYEKYVRENQELMDSLEELNGMTLGCWCKPNGCHGVVLVKLFNEL